MTSSLLVLACHPIGRIHVRARSVVGFAFCGVLERLAAVGFVALSRGAPLGGVLSALAVLVWRLGALPRA